MMINYYLKQTYHQFKQNKLLCGVYILGTGFSIAVVMALAIVYYIKIAPVYSEDNRNRMLYVNQTYEVDEREDSYSGGCLSYAALTDYFYPLRTPETVSASMGNSESIIQVPGSDLFHEVAVKMTDVAFWKVFPFHFIDGEPFTQGDFDSGIRRAVISASLARKLFNTTKATGASMLLDFTEYRICGVVEDASRVATNSFADVWLPYTVVPNYQNKFGKAGMLGSYEIFILAKNRGDFKDIRAEVAEIERKINGINPGLKFGFLGQPDTHLAHVVRKMDGNSYVVSSDTRSDLMRVFGILGIIVFILLLVPAVNLMSITSSRIEKRISELGIRKAFGAGRGVLIREMLVENFILTAVGGVVGLLISVLLVEVTRNWIFDVGAVYLEALPENTDIKISFGMMFNPIVFFITLFVCFVINMLSAWIPSWRFSRKKIVDSLNANK